MCRESPLFHHSVRLKRTDAVVGRSTLREKWWLLNIINRCQYYHVWADFHCRKYLQRKSEKGKIRIIFIKTEGSLPVTGCFLFLVSWWVSDSLRGRPVTAACNSSLFYYSSVHAQVWYTVCYTGIQIQTRGDLNAPWVMFNGKCTTVIYGGNLSIRHKQSNEMSSNNHIQHNEHRGLVYKYIQIQTGEDLNLGGIPGNSWWGYAARFSKSRPYNISDQKM